MPNFKMCSECKNQYYSGKCPWQKLHREVQQYIERMGEYDCKAFEQKPAPPPPMTSEQYEAKQKELLNGIPEEFQSALSYMAYEQGHSAGYDECIIVLSGLVSELRPVIKRYETRILSNQRPG